MRLIITEKPSVATDIAKVLKVKTKKEGYFENKETQIAWAYGHLIQLLDPEEYDKKLKSWSFKTLPIIPDTFEKKIINQKNSKKQALVIKKLLTQKTLTEVICATDAGREGELIFRYLYEFSGCKKPIKRLWISSQTDQAIKEGFENLKEGKIYDPLFDSAQCRSEADWLVGMNATRAYTITFGRGSGVMSVGRVQTPVLKMIVDRFRENKNFKPETYYEHHLTCEHENGPYQAKWFTKKTDRITDKKKADELKEKLKNEKEGQITSLKQTEKKERQPLLYDLTELQKDAYRNFKFSANRTLQAAQALYEKHKVLTYPRTSSRYLSTDIKPKLPNLIGLLKAIPQFETVSKKILDAPLNLNKRIVDDKKITDHHAIIPTEKPPKIDDLSEDEKKIYLLAIKRFLAVFLPECIKKNTQIITTVKEETFKTSGTVIAHPGWREVYLNPDKKEENLLPNVKKGDTVSIKKQEQKTCQTKPPPLHNEASILGAMETAGKEIEDEDLKEAIKDCGLGTPATRAQIIERLITVKYILREKNQLLPTEKGEFLIDHIQSPELLSPKMTGEWEKKLNLMAENKYKRDTYMKEIKTFANQIIDHLDEEKPDEVGIEKKRVVIGTCPCCQDEIEETLKSYKCGKCEFIIWKDIASKKISRSIAEEILKNKKTGVLEGFKNKRGSMFSAILKVEEEKIKFDFDFDFGPCPVCKEGRVIQTPKAFSCSTWKDKGCTFVIWKTIAGKTLSIEEVNTLLEHKETEKLSGFRSKSKKPFQAKLKLNDEGRVEFDFEAKQA